MHCAPFLLVFFAFFSKNLKATFVADAPMKKKIRKITSSHSTLKYGSKKTIEELVKKMGIWRCKGSFLSVLYPYDLAKILFLDVAGLI